MSLKEHLNKGLFSSDCGQFPFSTNPVSSVQVFSLKWCSVLVTWVMQGPCPLEEVLDLFCRVLILTGSVSPRGRHISQAQPFSLSLRTLLKRMM